MAEMTKDTVVKWLIDPVEPGVRAQALVHLMSRSPRDSDVQATRAGSLSHGAIARVRDGLIATTDPRALWEPKYGAPYHRLIALAQMGAQKDERIVAALDACLDAYAKPDGGFGHRASSHLCVTGNLLFAARRFGGAKDERVERGIAWLVAQQRADGGWNCFPEDERSTVDSWEPLAAFATIPPGQRSPDVRRAIDRGVGFLLDERLGVGVGYTPWERIHFPRHYYYDFLQGLELATELGDPRDPRLAPALDLLRAKRRADGTWALDSTHPDVDPEGDPPYKPIIAEFLRTVVRVELDPPGAPSRWATLAAMRVLRRTDGT